MWVTRVRSSHAGARAEAHRWHTRTMAQHLETLKLTCIRAIAAVRATDPRELAEKCANTWAFVQSEFRAARSASMVGVAAVFILGILLGVVLGAAATVALNFDNGIDAEQLASIIEEEVKLREAEREEKTLDLNGHDDKKRV